MTEEEYIGIVGEIFDGYSELDFFGVPIYLKHFSIKDQRHVHLIYEKYKRIALKKGIGTEKEILQKLKEEGLWSDEEDSKITILEKEIENLKLTKNSLFLFSEKKRFEEIILEKKKELDKLLKSRKDVVGKTAEDYASSMANEEFVRYILFKDKQLTVHYFSEKDFEELSDLELAILLKSYNEISERLNESIIQKTVLRDFFNMYLSLTDDVFSFYGKAVVDLSVYQLKLLLYAKIFFNIFQYNEDIPDNIKKDPDAIFSFSEMKRNKASSKTVNKIKNSDSVATAVFGATKEDIEHLGGSEKTVSLQDELAKRGGSMNMEDLMNLMS